MRARGQRVFPGRAATPSSALLHRAVAAQPSTTVAASAKPGFTDGLSVCR